MSKRPLHLSSPKEVRAALTKVVNEIRENKLSPQQGNAIITGCNTILQSIRVDELERKIATLEALLDDKEDG